MDGALVLYSLPFHGLIHTASNVAIVSPSVNVSPVKSIEEYVNSLRTLVTGSIDCIKSPAFGDAVEIVR